MRRCSPACAQRSGAEVPLVATFDIHANLSPALFAAADLLIGYDTYPHTDMAARGREAAAGLAGILASGRRPAKAFRKLPLLTVPQVQATAGSPMREVIAQLHAIEAMPEVLTASVAVGFPYADVPQQGVAVVAYGERQAAVEAVAERLAAALWARRHEFVPALVPADEAVRQALAAPPGPVVLVDVADNVGGGAPGDGTVILAGAAGGGRAGRGRGPVGAGGGARLRRAGSRRALPGDGRRQRPSPRAAGRARRHDRARRPGRVSPPEQLHDRPAGAARPGRGDRRRRARGADRAARDAVRCRPPARRRHRARGAADPGLQVRDRLAGGLWRDRDAPHLRRHARHLRRPISAGSPTARARPRCFPLDPAAGWP